MQYDQFPEWFRSLGWVEQMVLLTMVLIVLTLVLVAFVYFTGTIFRKYKHQRRPDVKKFGIYLSSICFVLFISIVIIVASPNFIKDLFNFSLFFSSLCFFSLVLPIFWRGRTFIVILVYALGGIVIATLLGVFRADGSFPLSIMTVIGVCYCAIPYFLTVFPLMQIRNRVISKTKYNAIVMTFIIFFSISIFLLVGALIEAYGVAVYLLPFACWFFYRGFIWNEHPQLGPGATWTMEFLDSFLKWEHFSGDIPATFVQVVCPTCGISGEIEPSSTMMTDPALIDIPSGLVCQHHFAVCVKENQVNGYRVTTKDIVLNRLPRNAFERAVYKLRIDQFCEVIKAALLSQPILFISHDHEVIGTLRSIFSQYLLHVEEEMLEVDSPANIPPGFEGLIINVEKGLIVQGIGNELTPAAPLLERILSLPDESTQRSIFGEYLSAIFKEFEYLKKTIENEDPPLYFDDLVKILSRNKKKSKMCEHLDFLLEMVRYREQSLFWRVQRLSDRIDIVKL